MGGAITEHDLKMAFTDGYNTGFEAAKNQRKEIAIVLDETGLRIEAAQPKWISVEERLPEERDAVAIIIRMGECIYLRIGWMRNAEPRWMQAGLGVIEGTVTHWIPLPEPPTTEQKEAD